ncbi:NUDIX domain-containing protein [Actinomycetospora straminea]|uniref:NUDIX domain-containing protein n=1 Tax=Actinomycetospora straminea TaxID=663607 RepID=UPI002365D3F4|nr:NUDIX domain-containing protein [Actinomycetospora straminea]MDD7932198.1 NUDIX domain-containing protein [Actinomycetospora straminea]
MTRRVVGALLVRDGRVLLCRRRADRAWYPGAWDVPGGHVEPGESARDALARECVEELGITVREAVARPPVAVDAGTELTVFLVRAWDGEPANRAPGEHDELGWCDADDARALPLVDPRLLALVVEVLAA